MCCAWYAPEHASTCAPIVHLCTSLAGRSECLACCRPTSLCRRIGMGRSAAGLITSRRGHEFCIGSRTASGSAQAAPTWRANVTPIRRPDCQRHASYSVLVVLTCKREHVWNTGRAFDFEARAVAPQIADRAVDSHPVIVRDSSALQRAAARFCLCSCI
jgi:hypothetical protein